MENDQQPTDDNATTMTAERGNHVASFAAYLTQQMVAAVNADDNVLEWEDVVFSAAMACRAIGQLAAVLTAKETGKEPDQQEADRRIAAILARAHNIKLVAMQVDNMAEAEAYIDGIDKGFH